MAEWFWRRKSKEQIVPVTDEPTFTSYVEQDGFVLVAQPLQQQTGPTPVEVSDYETLYQFRNMALNNRNYYPTSAPVTNQNMVYNSSASCQQQQQQQPIVYNVLPYQPTNNEQNDGVAAFLDGIPFRLANSFNALDTIRRIEQESFVFLRQKTEMLERLEYDFKLEKAVVREAEAWI